MFTGIIETTGFIKSITDVGADKRVHINTGGLDMRDVCPGDSISINGVCLTVIELGDDGFVADISTETIQYTTFKNIKEDARVNLEKAMQLSDRLGGHLVSGHIDGVGMVKHMQEDARSVRYTFECPQELSRYICKKGSICVDGVSLTVNDVDEVTFSVNIIPHTMQETIFSTYQESTPVNLEVDIVARYLERLQSKD